MTSTARTPNHVEGLSAQNTVSGKQEYVTSTGHALNVNASVSISGSPIPVTGATTAIVTAIVDGSGNQITSFGGGTQYTDGGTPPANPIGPTLEWNEGGTWRTVSSAKPLPVTASFSPSGTQDINLKQINGNTTSVGNGVAGTGVQRVTIASDNTAFSVNATLSAETTKVIGTVNQGTSPWVTSNATTSVVGNGAAATAQRVTIANDSTGTIAVTNTGTFAVQTSPAVLTTGGVSTVGTGSIGNTATAVKASAGQVYGYYFYNSNVTVAYVQFFNLATGSVTLGTTAPLASLGIPAGSGANLWLPTAWAFSTAITIGITTTRAGASSPSNTVDYNVWYA